MRQEGGSTSWAIAPFSISVLCVFKNFFNINIVLDKGLVESCKLVCIKYLYKHCIRCLDLYS